MMIALAFSGARFAHADEEADPRPVFGERPGYLFDVDGEKDKRDIEMVLVPPPKSTHEPISKVIFDEKLTKEFQEQYRYRFGETEAEQSLNNPARSDGYFYYDSRTVTVQDYQHYQENFANYMLRRLGEYHLDKTLKEEPSLKGIGEFKDNYSNLKVEPATGYNLKTNINISGPTVNLMLDNPYKIKNKIQLMLGQHDEIFSIGYDFTPLWSAEILYRQLQHLEQLVVKRKISRHMSATFTTSTGYLPDDNSDYQILYLVGLSYTLYP